MSPGTMLPEHTKHGIVYLLTVAEHDADDTPRSEGIMAVCRNLEPSRLGCQLVEGVLYLA